MSTRPVVERVPPRRVDAGLWWSILMLCMVEGVLAYGIWVLW